MWTKSALPQCDSDIDRTKSSIRRKMSEGKNESGKLDQSLCTGNSNSQQVNQSTTVYRMGSGDDQQMNFAKELKAIREENSSRERALRAQIDELQKTIETLNALLSLHTVPDTPSEDPENGIRALGLSLELIHERDAAYRETPQDKGAIPRKMFKTSHGKPVPVSVPATPSLTYAVETASRYESLGDIETEEHAPKRKPPNSTKNESRPALKAKPTPNTRVAQSATVPLKETVPAIIIEKG